MKMRILLLLGLNLLLIGGLFVILNQIGIVHFSFGKTEAPKGATEISSDPFLMEKEALRKQWAVLSAKENDLENRQSELDKSSKMLQEKEKTLSTQMDEFSEQQKQKNQDGTSEAREEESIRELANKVGNIAPNSGADILNDMDPVIAVETIKMMDKIATEKGAQSTSAYLISLMDPAKRKEVVRLLSAYPSSLGNLNVPTPPTANLPNSNSN